MVKPIPGDRGGFSLRARNASLPYPSIQIFATTRASPHRTATATRIRTIHLNNERPVATEAGSAKMSRNSAPAAVKAMRASIVYSLAWMCIFTGAGFGLSVQLTLPKNKEEHLCNTVFSARVVGSRMSAERCRLPVPGPGSAIPVVVKATACSAEAIAFQSMQVRR